MKNPLIEFIVGERNRYVNNDNNRFAESFWRVTHYMGYLEIIVQRYSNLSIAWHQNRKKFENYHKHSTKESLEKDMILLPGGGRINPIVISLFEEGEQVEGQIQLEIESFYLFATILLDNLARAIIRYFGATKMKKMPLNSHRSLTKNFSIYAKEKGIDLSNDLIKKAQELDDEILEFRIKQISHFKDADKNIYSSRMTLLDENGKYLKMRIIRFYSETKREEISSKKLDELLNKIINYTKLVTQMMRKNNYLSTYRLLTS